MAASKELVTKDTACVEHTRLEFKSDLLDELLSSQRQAAHFLELAHLALRDDPDIASEVRMTANESQDQHLKTHGLMKEYQGTALHVIHTMLPLVETGLKKKKELLVMKALKKVLTYVDAMIVKTEKTVKEYTKIKKDVNNEIRHITKKNKEIKDKGTKMVLEMNDEKRKLEEESNCLKVLQASKGNNEEKMEKLKSKRENFIADSVQKSGAMESFRDVFTAGLVSLGAIFRGEKFGVSMIEVVTKTSLERKDQASRQAIEASKETKKDIEEKQKEIEEQERRILKMKEEAIQSLATMEKLALENSNLMNEESLKMAERELGKVTLLFTKILSFWNEFSAKLSTLTKSHDAIESCIDFIDDPDLAEEIDKSVTTVKKMWTSFGNMCTDYVDKSQEQLPQLYEFMGTAVDQISIEACNKRKQELLESQRAEIKKIEEKIFKL